MNDTPLNLSFWKNSLYGIFKTWKAVHTEKENIFYSTILQIIEHAEYYYFRKDLLEEICKKLLSNISFRQLKEELFESGVLVCNNLEKRNFTLKKVVHTKEGEEMRLRFLKLKKEFFITDSGLFIEDLMN